MLCSYTSNLFLSMTVVLCLSVSAEEQIIVNGTTDPTCDFEGVSNITVHIGWPHYFSCYELAYKLGRKTGYTKYFRVYAKENATCTLKDENGIEQWHITATVKDMKRQTKVAYPELFDVTNNSTTYHRVEMNIAASNYCSYQDIRLERIKLDELACANSENFSTAIWRIRKGGLHRLQCVVDFGVKEIIYYHEANRNNFTYEWTYNCGTTLPNNTKISGDELLIPNTEFGVNGGIYTCSVKYKDQTRFVTRHSICVKHANDGKITLKCPEKAQAKLGSDVNITCNVDFGPGPFGRAFVTSNWTKTTSSGVKKALCLHVGIDFYGENYETTNSTNNERAQCETVIVSNINERCFIHDPSPEEREAMARFTRITLLIKKMTKSDVGSYTLEFDAATNELFYGTVNLELDNDDSLISYAKYIGFGISLLVLLILLILLCFWKKIDLLWFMKKYFGAFEEDNKTYLAYLSYHFSSDNMSETSKMLTSKLVESLNTVFVGFGGKVYDDHKDADEFQLQIENMEKFQTQCHRIVIILNPEYITDHWSLHKAYSALRNMIEGGAKVIFIALPGVEKSLKKIENESKTALKHAMKMNTTIEWSGKTPLSGKFCRHLEYALPKLRNEDKKRVRIEENEKILIENVHDA